MVPPIQDPEFPFTLANAVVLSRSLASTAERRECTESGRYIYLRKSHSVKSSKVSRV